MKRFFKFCLCGFSVLAIAGCATTPITQPSVKVDAHSGAGALPAYSGPKARIAVAEFEIKAAKASSEIGSGLREMLITTLVNSGRFSVVERQALNAVMQEQELAASGAAGQGQGPARGALKTADLVITAAVTEFEPQVSGGSAGIGGGGGIDSGFLGGLLGATLNRAHMALDIRIIDASTSEILAATRAQGQASDIAGGFMAGFLGGMGLGGGLSAYANTPMEKAIRICIIESIRYLVQVIPPQYYKY